MTTTAANSLLIDGQWCAADSGCTNAVVNPAIEETLAEVAYGGKAETGRAIEAASRAMPAWIERNAWGRAEILKRTATLLRERSDAAARRMFHASLVYLFVLLAAMLADLALGL